MSLRTITAQEVLEWAESKPANEVVWKHGSNSVTQCAVANYLRETTGEIHSVGMDSYSTADNIDNVGYIEKPLADTIDALCDIQNPTAGQLVNLLLERI